MKKLVLVLLLGNIYINAYANNCGGQFDPATGTCRIIEPDGKQILYNSASPQSSRTPHSKIIKYTNIYLPPKYGAIASDKKTGIVGSSHNFDSKDAAKKAAIQSCQNGNKKLSCKVVAFYGNGCISAASGSIAKKAILFQAVDENPGGYAAKKAIDKCQKFGASDCYILIQEECSRS